MAKAEKKSKDKYGVISMTTVKTKNMGYTREEIISEVYNKNKVIEKVVIKGENYFVVEN